MESRISKAIVASLLIGGVASTAALAGQVNPNVEMRPTGKGWGEAVSGRVDDAAKPGGSARPSSGITLHTGKVMHGTVNTYYIWYGDGWSTALGSEAKTILANFATSIGGSPYFNINKTYYDNSGSGGAKSYITGAVTQSGYTSVSYLPGTTGATSLSDAQILTIATNAITSGAFGPAGFVDTNGIYFVLTSSEVHKSGFGTSYCGWHSHATVGNQDMKYSFVGDPSVQAPSGCGGPGPNGSSGADAMASIIAHELEEAATDPDLDAWYDSRGAENADKCAWTFGTTYLSGGKPANVHLGSRDYLIQQNWNYNSTVSSQKCAML